MDRPDASRRPYASDTPVLIALTEDERLHALDLFADEPLRSEQSQDDDPRIYQCVPAYVGRIAPLEVRTAPAIQAGTWASPSWQAPRWGAVLIAIVVIYTATTVLLMRTTAGGQIATAADVVLPSTVTLPVTEAPKEEPAAAVSRESASLPVAAPSGPPLSLKSEAPRVRPDARIRTALVSAPAKAEPLPIVESRLAPLPASPALPASLAVEPRPVAAVPATPPRVEASAAPVARVPAPETAIQTVLSQYRTAYRELDASAARAIWPSVDAKALRRAFDHLEQQDLIFDSCQIAVSAASAVASCRGFAWYVPRVGNKSPHDDQRQWEFRLSKVDEAWLIETVSAR